MTAVERVFRSLAGMQGGGIEYGNGSIARRYQHGNFRAAKDDALRASVDQRLDHLAIRLARLVTHNAAAHFVENHLMYKVAISLIRNQRIEVMPFAQSLLVKILLHRKTRTEQTDLLQSVAPDFLCRRVRYME